MQRLGHRNRGQGGQQIRTRQNGSDGGEMRHPAGDAPLHTGRGGREIDRARQTVANPHHQMRPLRPARTSPFGQRRMFLTAEASPFQPADGFAVDALGHAELRRHDRDIDQPLRHIQQRRLARRGPLEGNT